MKLHKEARKPKIYKKPQHISLEATGLLAHAREYSDSNGNFSWGVGKTGDFFGVSKNTMSLCFDELEEAKLVEVTQSGKDPVTGKNLLKVIRPRRGPRPQPAPTTPDPENPCLQIGMESSNTNEGSSQVSTGEGKTKVTGDPHTANCSPEYVVSDIKSSCSIKTVDVRVTDNPGSPEAPQATSQGNPPDPPAKTKNLAALLREEQAELAFWVSSNQTKRADACRKRIAELEADGQRPGVSIRVSEEK